MRNIVEYPITLDEIVECLKELQLDAQASGAIGSMTPLLLDYAICAVRYRELKLWERGDLHGMERSLARLKDAPAADEDLPFCSYCGATESDWNLGLLPAAPPSPVEHAGLIERLLGPYPDSDAMKLAAAAIASLSEDLRECQDMLFGVCDARDRYKEGWAQAEAERDALVVQIVQIEVENNRQRKRAEQAEADNDGFRKSLKIAMAERDDALALAKRSTERLAEMAEPGFIGAFAARDAATAEVKRLREALTTDPTFSENARLFREATLAACDERLNEYKHRAREAEAEVKRFREALEAAEGELVNLLPHIPQACIPGHAGFIDAHVDEAISIIRTALAKTQEPK